MRIAGRLLTASTAALALAAPASGQGRPLSTPREDEARLRAAVEASAARVTAAFNRGDIPGFIRSYADDIWVFPPNEQPFQGRDASLGYYQRSYDRGLRNFQITTTGLDRQGSMAYETGIYTVDYPTPGQRGAMTRDNGKYVQVWKRSSNGDWRTHFVMWSSNLPPPPTQR